MTDMTPEEASKHLASKAFWAGNRTFEAYCDEVAPLILAEIQAQREQAVREAGSVMFKVDESEFLDLKPGGVAPMPDHLLYLTAADQEHISLLETENTQLKAQVAACVEALTYACQCTDGMHEGTDGTCMACETRHDLQSTAKDWEETVRADERESTADIFRTIEQPPETIRIDDVVELILDACDSDSMEGE